MGEIADSNFNTFAGVQLVSYWYKVYGAPDVPDYCRRL